MAFPYANADLKQAYADLIGQALASLPTNIDNIITHSNAASLAEINRKLRGRGLTAAQVLTWADGEEYQRDIGLYFTILKANGTETLPPGTTATWGYLDRRAELETVTLIDTDGELIEAEDTDQIGHGELNTDGDLNVPDPWDVRRGQITRW